MIEVHVYYDTDNLYRYQEIRIFGLLVFRLKKRYHYDKDIIY